MDNPMVIVDGRYLYDGHRLAWRRGRVLDSSKDGAFVTVEIQPVGRERKARIQRFPVGWLLVDTQPLRDKLTEAGLLIEMDRTAVQQDDTP